MEKPLYKDQGMTWTHYMYYWPFVRGIVRLPMDSQHKRDVINVYVPMESQDYMLINRLYVSYTQHLLSNVESSIYLTEIPDP